MAANASSNSHDASWAELARLLKTLPPEEQRQHKAAIGRYIQELRHSVSVIHTAESLLRHNAHNPDDIEQLNQLHSANGKTLALIAELGRHFDSGFTVPVGGLPSSKDKA